MEGRARAAKHEVDVAIATAWHGEAFARTKRLKRLSSYLEGDVRTKVEAPANDADGVLSLFKDMAAKGKDVKISRVN